MVELQENNVFCFIVYVFVVYVIKYMVCLYSKNLFLFFFNVRKIRIRESVQVVKSKGLEYKFYFYVFQYFDFGQCFDFFIEFYSCLNFKYLFIGKVLGIVEKLNDLIFIFY